MIRPVSTDDIQQITDIYNYYIENTAISFETAPLSYAQMADRIAAISSKYPYIVYEVDGKVVGYCYAHEWKERAAYSQTLETTIYLSKDCLGHGYGFELMQQLIALCRQAGYGALIACITDGNEHSCHLHERLGFKQVSLFEKVGMKFGRRLDVVDYELLLI